MTQLFAKVQKPYFWAYLGLYIAQLCSHFRGEGVEIEKKLSTSIWKYISPTIQIWNQIFKIFSSCVGYCHFASSPKTLFLPFLGTFCFKSRELEFSQIWDFRRKLANHNTLHFRSFLAKTNDSILRKSPKTLFLGLFRPLFPIFEKMRIFPKNPALSLFYIYGPLTSCKKSEKTNEPIPRTLRYARTDGRTDARTDVNS